MIEVYSGSKPGRPVVLLLVCAAMLFAALGAAALQTRGKRMLGPEIALPGTPLIVRVPLGWQQNPHDPGQFALLDPAERGLPAAQRSYERGVRISYQRVDSFIAPEFMLPPATEVEHTAVETTQGMIGGIPAVQIRRFRSLEFRGEVLTQQWLTRVACTTRGDVIRIEYEPRLGPTTADMALLDAVCAAVRLQTSGAYVASGTQPSDVRVAAGLALDAPANCTIVAHDDDAFPSLGIVGQEEGVPAYSVVVRRTWLAHDRRPIDLLVDFVDVVWKRPTYKYDLRQWSRLDGVEVVSLVNREVGDAAALLGAVHVVSAGPDRTAIVAASRESFNRPDARRVAAQIAREIRIDAIPGGLDIDAAVRRGGDLVTALTEKGALPWWGRAQVRSRLVSDDAGAALLLIRAPAESGPQSGYTGGSAILFQALREFRTYRWWMDGRAMAYEFTFKEGLASDLTGRPARTIVESRSGGDGSIRRVTSAAGDKREVTLAPSRSFVPPPAELAAALYVKGRGDDWIIQSSTVQGSTLHTKLIRAMPADEAGNARVMLAMDFWPQRDVFVLHATTDEFIGRDTGALHLRPASDAAGDSPVFRRLAEWLRPQR